MKKQTLLGALLAVCAATSTALAGQGPERDRIPEDTLLPYYARIWVDPTGSQICQDGTWAAIAFYFEPHDVLPSPVDPDDPFNLLDFYDFRIWSDLGAQLPMTVSGFWLWDVSIPMPVQINLHGNGAVPVWFVSWAELQMAIADRNLSVPELETLSSLKMGTAEVYNEELLPGKHITISAQGRFEDGGRFQFHAVGTSVGFDVTHIRIW